MKINFSKYHGTGNDFILIDNRDEKIQLTNQQIANLCHRRFGIGADGLMLLQNHSEYNFEMIYYNSDGHKSSMCGNGGRCISAYAHSLGIFKKDVSFFAIGKKYHASLLNENSQDKDFKNTPLNISLEMNDVFHANVIKENIEDKENCFFVIDTGSPHYIKFVENLEEDFVKKAKKIRYSKKWQKEGINVNFVSVGEDNQIAMRTYERGVEDETYSCGTGAVACALATDIYQSLGESENLSKNNNQKRIINITTKGGELNVSFENNEQSYQKIFLSGATVKVFDGEVFL